MRNINGDLYEIFPAAGRWLWEAEREITHGNNIVTPKEKDAVIHLFHEQPKNTIAEGNCSCSTFGRCHTVHRNVCMQRLVGVATANCTIHFRKLAGRWSRSSEAFGNKQIFSLALSNFKILARLVFKWQTTLNYLKNFHDCHISDSSLSRHNGICKLQ